MTIKKAIDQIRQDLIKQLKVFELENKLIEKQRLDELGIRLIEKKYSLQRSTHRAVKTL